MHTKEFYNWPPFMKVVYGSSNSVGDSGNMEQFGEEGDGFCRRQ